MASKFIRFQDRGGRGWWIPVRNIVAVSAQIIRGDEPRESHTALVNWGEGGTRQFEFSNAEDFFSLIGLATESAEYQEDMDTRALDELSKEAAKFGMRITR